MPEWQVTALLDLQQYYVNGQGGEVDDILETLLGRKPITLDQFLKNHFEEFVNRKNLDIAYVNFAPEFVDHGSDVPSGPEGATQYSSYEEREGQLGSARRRTGSLCPRRRRARP